MAPRRARALPPGLGRRPGLRRRGHAPGRAQAGGQGPLDRGGAGGRARERRGRVPQARGALGRVEASPQGGAGPPPGRAARRRPARPREPGPLRAGARARARGPGPAPAGGGEPRPAAAGRGRGAGRRAPRRGRGPGRGGDAPARALLPTRGRALDLARGVLPPARVREAQGQVGPSGRGRAAEGRARAAAPSRRRTRRAARSAAPHGAPTGRWTRWRPRRRSWPAPRPGSSTTRASWCGSRGCWSARAAT